MDHNFSREIRPAVRLNFHSRDEKGLRQTGPEAVCLLLMSGVY